MSKVDFRKVLYLAIPLAKHLLAMLVTVLLASQPISGQTIEESATRKLDAVIFPSIVTEGNYVRFAVRDLDGQWFYEKLTARAVEQRAGFRVLEAFIPYSLSTQSHDKLTITRKEGDSESSFTLPGVEVVSSEDLVLAGSCTPPTQNASQGDVVCIPSEQPFSLGQTVFLIGADGSKIDLPIIASSRHTLYCVISRDVPSGSYQVAIADQRLPITIHAAPSRTGLAMAIGVSPEDIFMENSYSIHDCDCVSRNSIPPAIQPNLTAAEIERLQGLVASVLTAAENQLNLETNELQASPESFFDKASLLTIAEKVENLLLERLKRESTLDGFRDYIEFRFSYEAMHLSGINSKANSILTASLAKVERDLITREEGDNFLNRLRAILALLRSENEHPFLSLAIKTSPTGASFSMHPLSSGVPEYRTPTPGTIDGIWIGIYSTTVSRRSLEHSSVINLVDDRRSVLTCNLFLLGKEKEICGRQD